MTISEATCFNKPCMKFLTFAFVHYSSPLSGEKREQQSPRWSESEKLSMLKGPDHGELILSWLSSLSCAPLPFPKYFWIVENTNPGMSHLREEFWESLTFINRCCSWLMRCSTVNLDKVTPRGTFFRRGGQDAISLCSIKLGK